jgi:pyruvate/2-oxoacid:ferredoxin oxidoreductase alpha subunit
MSSCADSMSERDTGWIQLYCSSAQELMDSILCAYRIAEEAMLPVLVCAEGFLLSHTAEVVDVPSQEAVDAFLPRFDPPAEWLFDPLNPRAFSGVPDPTEYATFQRRVADAHDRTRMLLTDVAAEFATVFGREKVASIELSGDPSAETAIVTIGTIGETARELLADANPPLVARVHAYRPFPIGPLGEDVRAYGISATDVLCGLGGSDVTPDTLREALAASGREAIYLGVEA